MSRAFVINGDEWGFCKKREMRCSGANEEGLCMRPECTEIPAWEQPKRDVRAERLRKLTVLQEQAEKSQPKAKATAQTPSGKAVPAKPAFTVRPAAKNAAKPASAGNTVKSIWKPVPVKKPQKWK